MLLSQSAGGAAGFAAAAGDLSGSDAAAFGNIPAEAVAAIHIRLTGVDALPADRDENVPGAWITLRLDGPTEVNLWALPHDPAHAIVLARGDLPPGTYRNLRLRYDEAWITLAEPVALGASPNHRYEPGVYPLRIPSGPQTGIKVPRASFVVADGAGADVHLIFDAATSVRSIQLTGHGFQMNPVIHQRGN